jgi:hypothetical protein
VFELGNDVTALESVPTALFAFLRGCRRFPGPRQFQHTIRWELGICFMYRSIPLPPVPVPPYRQEGSVADLDAGSGAFLTPRPGFQPHIFEAK